MKDVIDRKWLARSIIEFKPKCLLNLSVYSAVLETPKETHYPRESIEFELVDKN